MPIPGVRRPCIACGTLGTASYCQPCEAEREREESKRRGQRHYVGGYRKRAAQVRASATVCWLCGEGARGEADPWTADHVVPGDPYSPLAPAHRSCNSRRRDEKRGKTRA